MSGPASIEFQHVWKRFPRSTGRLLLRTQLKQFFSGRVLQEPFYALKDVSFQVARGESVAILGANGAGKSTLLSLVAGLAPPDGGSVSVRGNIAPLLELAAGFHGDLTGAENLALNASLLGIGRKELTRLAAQIVEFSELGEFINEPLRTYSSGMIMRLAFSVAINIDPDILLIDEILAVGDSAFQAKCFERVLDFRRRGKTILCVSHSPGMVQKLCDRALWLDHGDVMLDGRLQEVADAYEGRLRAGRDS
jgi:ABC-type polysaccharide/polyol phosphate transport system ATPase subunit